MRQEESDVFLGSTPSSRQEQSRRGARDHERHNSDERPFERVEEGDGDCRLRIVEIPVRVGVAQNREACEN